MGGLPIDSFTGAAGGRMFFFGNSRLWRTDGTPAGTIGVTSADVSFGPRAAPFGDGVLVVGGINVIAILDSIVTSAVMSHWLHRRLERAHLS